MKRYEHLKRKSLQLRNSGMALSEICKRLSLGKTTVYYWIKDIHISRTIKQKQSQIDGTKAMRLKGAALREDAYKDGLCKYSDMVAQSSFRDFIMVYLTEGYRRTKHQVAVSNSNPNIVVLAFKWIKKLMNQDRKMDFNLQCHVDNNEDELKEFWAKKLGIENEQIKIRRKSNSGELSGRQWRSVHGVFTIRANDTYLRSRIEAWMDKIQEEWI